jgi:hypothetical protein
LKKGRITIKVKDPDAPKTDPTTDPNTRFRARVFMSKKIKIDTKTKNFVNTILQSEKDSGPYEKIKFFKT